MSGAVKRIDDVRHECRCEPFAQRWRPEAPERCANCGGMFPPHTVNARRLRPGDPWPTHDAHGNALAHAELCAWRFGGNCDCAAGAVDE
jgi:hypothetical protein